MFPVTPVSPNQRPGFSATQTPLHVYLKGRRVIIPVEKLAYVEIAEAAQRPVGFTAG